jgi:hypothetical protein
VTALPHTFKRIRLSLARSKEFPQGSSQHGDEFVGPLDGNGHIDAALWKQHRHSCGARRFWKGEPNEHCLLVHRPGGPDHGRWVFKMMMKAAIASARMYFTQVNMSAS